MENDGPTFQMEFCTDIHVCMYCMRYRANFPPWKLNIRMSLHVIMLSSVVFVGGTAQGGNSRPINPVQFKVIC